MTENFWQMVQALSLVTTIPLIWHYAHQTKKLRDAASDQVKAMLQQVEETQRHTEVQQRPFVIIQSAQYDREFKAFNVQNIGNSLAMDINITHDNSSINIPFLRTVDDENINVKISPTPVNEPSKGGRSNGHYEMLLYQEEINKDYLIFRVEFKNVEEKFYTNNVRATPDTIELLCLKPR